MMLPVGQQTLHQLRATQEWAVRRGSTSQGDVVASARAGMSPVEHKLLRAETGQTRLLVEGSQMFNNLLPVVRRMDIDLDHSRIWGHGKAPEPPISRRRV